MEQIARIIGTDGGTAVIEAERSSMCEGCSGKECGASCAMSGIFGSGKSMRTKARNGVGALPGDLVEVESSSSTVLGHAFLLFIMPILICGACFFAGRRIFSSELWGAVAAAGGLVLSGVILFVIERVVSRRAPSVTIRRIVRRASDGAAADNTNERTGSGDES